MGSRGELKRLDEDNRLVNLVSGTGKEERMERIEGDRRNGGGRGIVACSEQIM